VGEMTLAVPGCHGIRRTRAARCRRQVVRLHTPQFERRADGTFSSIRCLREWY